MRENLIPTPRTDKNGRTVIRHMRTDGAASPSAASSLPAPALATAPAKVFTPDEMLYFVQSKLPKEQPFNVAVHNETVYKTLRALRSYPQDYLNELHQTLMEGDEGTAAVIAEKIATGHSDHVDLREYAFFLPKINMDNKRNAKVLLETMRDYMDMGVIPAAWDYSEADELVQKQCLALLNVAAAIEATGTGNNWTSLPLSKEHLNKRPENVAAMQRSLARLRDNELVVALVTRPGEAEDIISVIREYRVSDYRSIKALLDGIAPSLSGGAL